MSIDPRLTSLPRGQLRVRAANPEFEQLIRNADILLAADSRNPRHTWVVFPDAIHQNHAGPDDRTALVLTVPVDFETDDAEVLRALCKALKGSCRLPTSAAD